MYFHKLAFVTSVSAAAVAVGFYVFWKPGGRKKKTPNALCAGLHNTGNICFVNCIVQAVSACRSSVDWLQQFLSHQQVASRTHFLADALLNLMMAINYETEETEDAFFATKLVNELRRRRWHISPHEQDAHEFFHVVMETIDEETMRYPTVISLFDLKSLQSPMNKYQSEACARSRTSGLLPVLPRQCLDNPFRGLLATQLKCTKCSYQHPINYGSFDSLSLPIPSNIWGTVTLKDLLRNFVKSEHVSNVECPGCAKLITDNPTNKLPRSTFSKTTTLAKLPQCLCVHIQRSLWLDNGMPVKSFNRVIFPEVLSLDEYAYINVTHGASHGLRGGHEDHRPRNLSLSSHPHQPTDYSPTMNLLRSLNFQSQLPSNSFLLQSPSMVSMTTHSEFTDINQNTPNIPEYVTQTGNYLYQLVANVCHIGGVDSGHFITCRRAPSNSRQLSRRWLFTSDSDVKLITFSEVMASADVYMLFYEKVS